MDALVLRGEVTASRLHHARQAPAVRKRDRDDCARGEPGQLHVEPVPTGARRVQEHELAADRVDRDVHPTVVGDICRGHAAPVQAHALRRNQVLGAPEGRRALDRRQYAHGFRVGGEVRDRDRAGGEQQVRPAGVGEVDPRRAPAGEAGAERRVEARPHARERAARSLLVCGGGLIARVGHEEAEAAARRGAGRHTHPGVLVGDAGGRRALLEAEPEPGRIGGRAAGPRDVDVELVRVLVVRDVDVRAAVSVGVGERRAEPVSEGGGLEARLVADLLEPTPACVQIEQVADAGHVRREAGEGVRHRLAQVGVAGDEEIRPAVAVHVRDGRAGVPAARRELRLGERPVAGVPQDVDAARRRHDEVGVAVAVQIRGDAAVALDGQIGMRGGADVLERAVGRSRRAHVRGRPPWASHCEVSALRRS